MRFLNPGTHSRWDRSGNEASTAPSQGTTFVDIPQLKSGSLVRALRRLTRATSWPGAVCNSAHPAIAQATSTQLEGSRTSPCTSTMSHPARGGRGDQPGRERPSQGAGTRDRVGERLARVEPTSRQASRHPRGD